MKKGIPGLMLILALLCTACLQEPPPVSTEPSTEAVLSTEMTQDTTVPASPTQAATVPTETTETAPTETAPPETTQPVRVLTVCIDAGHQQAGIPEKEPNGPGSSVMKAKLTSGTQGAATGIEEYKLNLEVSLLLEQELLNRGYRVVMIRRTNDCPLSNAERAVIANESGADIFVRIHANGSEDPTVQGMLCCVPTQKNPYLSAELVAESVRLSQAVTEGFCARTGAKNRGLYAVDTMTGINWCQIPVTIVEMGFMSSPEEDRKMATQEYRALMAQGIADGIDAYFKTE